MSSGRDQDSPTCTTSALERSQFYQLQVPAWQGEGSSVGSNVLPPLPSPLSREIRMGSHEKGGERVYFCLIIKNFYNVYLESCLFTGRAKPMSPRGGPVQGAPIFRARSMEHTQPHPGPHTGPQVPVSKLPSAAPTSARSPALCTRKESCVLAMLINMETPSLLAV